MPLTDEYAERMSATTAAQLAGLALVPLCALAISLSACGSTTPSAADPPDFPPSSEPGDATRPVGPEAAAAGAVSTARAAKRAYNRETRGSKLSSETARIARDGTLLTALASGDIAAAQAEAEAQLFSAANHYGHVTRIGVVRGARVLVNATLNSDGAFVVAPARRDLKLRGRSVGTLLVSIQDVTGFVKLIHRRTGAEVVVRGAGGQIRASLPAGEYVRLPAAGSVSIAGRSYVVRSFHEFGWANEALTVWILQHA